MDKLMLAGTMVGPATRKYLKGNNRILFHATGRCLTHHPCHRIHAAMNSQLYHMRGEGSVIPVGWIVYRVNNKVGLDGKRDSIDEWVDGWMF